MMKSSIGHWFWQKGCDEKKRRAIFFHKKWRQPMLAGIFSAWFLPQIAGAQAVIVNSVLPAPKTAGKPATYRVRFTASSGLALTDKILIKFPTGFDFDLSGVSVASFELGATGGLQVESNSGRDLKLKRDDSGTTVPPGGQVGVFFSLVTNTTTPGSNFQLSVETQSSLNNTKDGPGLSPPFTIESSGEPYGDIFLHATKSKLPANNNDTTRVSTSQSIKDKQGNPVGANKLLTVAVNDTSLGKIISADQDITLPGLQVKTNLTSNISFIFQAGRNGGTATISVTGGSSGAASGSISLSINQLRILSIQAGRDTMSTGQANIPVTMVLQNVGRDPIKFSEANLSFDVISPFGASPDFVVTRISPAAGTLVPGNFQTLNVLFNIAYAADKNGGGFIIDGTALAEVLIPNDIGDTGADQIDSIFVQQAPALSYIAGTLSPQNVSVGSSYRFSLRVHNAGNAPLLLNPDATSLRLDAGTNSYIAKLDANSVRTIMSGDTTITFQSTNIPNEFPQTSYQPNIVIAGTHNGAPFLENSFLVEPVQVGEGAPFEILSITPSQATVTQNMVKEWFIDVAVRNNNSFALRFHSANIEQIVVNGQPDDYDIQEPTAFSTGGGFVTMAANSTDSLKFKVIRTGNLIGTAAIVAVVRTTNAENESEFHVANSPGTQGRFVVQTPAALNLTLAPSQPFVTQNQTQDWRVMMNITNTGGSEVQVLFRDSPPLVAIGDFPEDGVIPDTALVDGLPRDIIQGGSTRSLMFTVDQSGQSTGEKIVSGILDVMEVNSDRLFSTNARDTSVTVQTPAQIGIIETKLAQVFNGDSVNTGQPFQVRVKYQNRGEEGLDRVWVRLAGDGSSDIANNVVAAVGDSAVFDLTAAAVRNLAGETFTAFIDSSVASNTKAEAMLLGDVDNTAQLYVNNPASLEQLEVTTDLSQDAVAALQTADWRVFVALRAADNAADVVLDSIPDLNLSISGAPATDYFINKPAGFSQSGSLRLRSGSIDTLIYVVDRTGSQGGELSVSVNVDGRDVNDLRLLPAEGQKIVLVLTQTVASIVSAGFAEGANTNGIIGFVNTNQEFLIKVGVQNLGFEDVEWAAVSIEKTSVNGGTEIVTAQDTIRNIPTQSVREGAFTIRAANTPSLNGDFEVFKVRIDSVRTLTTAGNIGRPINNDSVKVQVQRPAQLEIQVETSAPDNQLTLGQDFEIRARVLNRGGAPYADNGQLRISAVPATGYTVSNNVPKSFSQGTTVVWQATAPDQTSEGDVFQITMSPIPRDRNSGAPAQVVNSNPANLVVGVSSSALSVRSVFIGGPEGARDNVVSTEQTFLVVAKLNRSANVATATAKLELAGGYRLTPGDSAEKTVAGDSVAWQVRAPSSADGQVELKVLVSGRDSGGQPLPPSSLSTLVQAESRASLTLIPAFIDPPGAAGGRLALGQNFKISAKLSNGGAAQTYDTASVSLDLGNTGITVIEPLEQTLVIPPDAYTGEVIWSARAPDTVSLGQQLRFTVTRLPKDENTDAEPSILLRVVNFDVSTEDHGSLAVSDVQVFEPEGAKDSTLSTEQIFTLSANVAWLRAAPVKAKLILPPGLGFLPEPLDDDLEVIFTDPNAETGRIAYWKVRAASQAFERAVFRVEVMATDASNPDYALPAAVDSVALKFVRRADFVFSGEVTAPAAARDRVVSTGQSFEVSAVLNNLGDAQAVGPDSILLILPEGYTLDRRVDTTLIKSSAAAGKQRRASWWVVAPNRKSPNPTGAEFVLQLQDRANDENTNQAAGFNTLRTQFNVIVQETRLIVNAVNTNRQSPVARGQNSLPVLDLELQNTGASDNANMILLEKMYVYVKDQSGNNISPRALLRALRLVKADDPTQIYGSVDLTSFQTGNPVVLPLSGPGFTASHVVTLMADLADTDSVSAFSLGFQHSNDVVARDQDSDSLVTVVDAAGRTGSNFKVVSSLAVLVDASFNNFFNYPNPMSAGPLPDAGTQFVYFLPKDSEVALEVYTMLGELVWKTRYLPTDPEGRQGSHGARGGSLTLPGITWDGLNGSGRKVLNGVYVAVLKTNSGAVRTKVAVVK